MYLTPSSRVSLPCPLYFVYQMDKVEVKGLEVYMAESGLEIWQFTEGHPKVQNGQIVSGWADIIDWGEAGLYEIKPDTQYWVEVGYAKAALYIHAWNNAVEAGNLKAIPPVIVSYGMRYPQMWVLVGPDPSNSDKWIKARLSMWTGLGGVIVYKSEPRKQGEPAPTYAYAWNPETQKAERRQFAYATVPVYQGIPQLVPEPLPSIPPVIIYGGGALAAGIIIWYW